MRIYSITLLLLLINSLSFGQEIDPWFSFWNSDSTLIGYKNQKGIVKIEPKFVAISNASRFDGLIAAIEQRDEAWDYYYLLKSGAIVGRDSLYFYDNAPDCESEGFIRFRDRSTDKVGMFDKAGYMCIPAEYNDLLNVRNGLVVGLKGAKKKQWPSGEHYSWVGGTQVVLDTANRVLIEDFSYDKSINFFSMEKTSNPHPDTKRRSFLGVDGAYYSFVDFEKEFKQWLFNDFLIGLNEEMLIKASNDTIVWGAANGWEYTEKTHFIKSNFNLLKKVFLEVMEPQCDFFITQDGLNPFMFEGAAYSSYFNNCREAKDWLYPTMTVVVSHGNEKDFTQNHYEFLRTAVGYKLLTVTIRNDSIQIP